MFYVFCKNNTMNNKQKGKFGEETACNFLKKQGFKILETNYRYSKIAEIDIIAQKSDVIHFVEVKTRRKNSYNPMEAITKTKLNSILNCARFYMSNSKMHYKQMRIDAIAIVLDDNQTPEINFIENISLN